MEKTNMSKDDYFTEREATVTITLHEYRELIKNTVLANHQIDDIKKDIAKCKEENERLDGRVWLQSTEIKALKKRLDAFASRDESEVPEND